VLIEHRGSVPQVHPSAYVAPTAVICGAVRIGPETRVLFGAVLTAEDGRISVGARSIVMENAVIRGRAQHPAIIGDDVLVGPHAHVNGKGTGHARSVAAGHQPSHVLAGIGASCLGEGISRPEGAR
jgi:carbonic anhydrase/acetyltransferase-like protein (isoleucine patch superfamily)